IEVGQTITATLDYAAEDQWTIILSEGDVISAATFSDDFDTYLYLYDAEGQEITHNDDTFGLNSMIRGFAAPADGEYIFGVRDFGDNSTGDYTLTVVAGDVLVIPEAYDQGTLPLNEPVTATFSGDTRLHVWTFEAGAGQALTLDYDYDELYLNIVDADGGYYSYFEPGEPLTFETAGLYYLVLEGYSDSYTITLSTGGEGPVVVETPVVPVPVGELPAVAGVLVPGRSASAYLAEGMTGTWVLEATAGDVLTIAAYSYDFDTVLALVDANGNEVAYDDDGGAGLNSLIRGWVAPATGAYTVRLHDFADNDSGEYTLLVLPGDQFVLPPTWDQGPVPFGVGAGSFTADVSVNVYSFAVGAGNVPMDLQLDVIAGTIYSGELWDADGYYLMYFVPGEAVRVETPGTYYLALYGGTGDYRFSFGPVGSGSSVPPVVTPTPIPPTVPPTLPPSPTWEPTPTYVPTEAPAGVTARIAFGQSLTGNLAPGANDYWVFIASAGQTIRIDLTATDDAFDTTLTLRNPNGIDIAYDDDGGPNYNSMLSDFVLPVDGMYTIRVGSFANAGGGPYTITLTDQAATTAPAMSVMPSPTPAILCQVSVQQAGVVSVYSEPSATSRITGTTFQNVVLDVLQVQTAADGSVWYEVSYDSGLGRVGGWVPSDAVVELTECPA
ncbi:MAG: PPC domain-containing protein, partial [Anaerolineae bacterium]|nr:PPC domain-containing protein [Anaerolineae bacterium]